MAIGRGAAFGLGYRASARVALAPAWSVYDGRRRLRRGKERLAIEAAREVLPRTPVRIRVESDIPAERGLKSSSAVSLAVVDAALRLSNRRWSPERRLKAAANAGLRSGTSLTGAFDDAAACLLGGVVLTDNRARRILARYELPPGLVALVHVPARRRPTASVRGTDFRPIAALVDDAFHLAMRRQVRDAMFLNSAAYAAVFRLRPRFSAAALEMGVYAAGLSGKGPAEIALGRRDQLRDLARRFPNTRWVRLRRGVP